MVEEKLPPEIPEVPPEFLEAKKRWGFKKPLPFIILGILILTLFPLISRLLPFLKKLRKPKEVTLTYWGLWEPESVFEPLIADFQKENPHIKIKYVYQSPRDYRERLQSALARGEGPDIFRFHNTWLPMLKNELTPVPPNVFSNAFFEKTFYPTVKKDLYFEGSFYGIPLMFDGLALFINEEIFKAAGAEPPTSWEELRELASKLTVYDEEGRIKTAGVALGEVSNVDHWSDILALMMLQNGADLERPTGELAEDALVFFTLFTTTDRVWDKTLPPSTYAFATGKLAMYFAPSWRVFNIKEINPNLSFKIVPLPQLPGTKISWASYWVEGVSKKSKYQEEAWKFLKYLSEKETMKKFYSQAAKIRLFGEIPSRVDLKELVSSDPLVAPFLEQAPYAQSWYLCSRTWDNGINDKIIKYFEDAVNKVLRGGNVEEALATAAQGVSQVLSQYKVASSL